MNGEAQVREIVDSYTPLVRATARRYEGRGADYEDLVQEGYLALLILIPKCPDMKWLAHFLKNNLPGLVRDAAARMRRGRAQGDEVLLEEIEETAGAEEEGPSNFRIQSQAAIYHKKKKHSSFFCSVQLGKFRVCFHKNISNHHTICPDPTIRHIRKTI